ncbi:hypothetical protein BC939DRAFT_530964 [Gamsiella multidivaricata]|uniref:uncharacterized protein n=1 Tax=Gamsiella multidivaricata TaxID=101098 RepID=UPI00221FE574|nr:uncharacterized protein BC939DRAFT_530964 [Gamsiella multidivaricata]KAI7819969.1 hypothetical protein BC939DRAFT_530964 [Gamsiella multidivaricata]
MIHGEEAYDPKQETFLRTTQSRALARRHRGNKARLRINQQILAKDEVIRAKDAVIAAKDDAIAQKDLALKAERELREHLQRQLKITTAGVIKKSGLANFKSASSQAQEFATPKVHQRALAASSVPVGRDHENVLTEKRVRKQHQQSTLFTRRPSANNLRSMVSIASAQANYTPHTVSTAADIPTRDSTSPVLQELENYVERLSFLKDAEVGGLKKKQ